MGYGWLAILFYFMIYSKVVHTHVYICVYIHISVQFSCSVRSNSLQPHEPQHNRSPCPSHSWSPPKPHVHWVSDAVQPSHPLSSPSPPALNLSQHQGLFQWVTYSSAYCISLWFMPGHWIQFPGFCTGPYCLSILYAIVFISLWIPNSQPFSSPPLSNHKHVVYLCESVFCR